jgi:hypothetical protein
VVELPVILKPYETSISEWLQYKRERKETYKPTGLKALYGKMSGFGDKLPAVIQQSMANGWKGLFELNGGRSANNRAETSKAGHQSASHAQDYAELEARAVKVTADGSGVPARPFGLAPCSAKDAHSDT